MPCMLEIAVDGDTETLDGELDGDRIVLKPDDQPIREADAAERDGQVRDHLRPPAPERRHAANGALGIAVAGCAGTPLRRPRCTLLLATMIDPRDRHRCLRARAADLSGIWVIDQRVWRQQLDGMVGACWRACRPIWRRRCGRRGMDPAELLRRQAAQRARRHHRVPAQRRSPLGHPARGRQRGRPLDAGGRPAAGRGRRRRRARGDGRHRSRATGSRSSRSSRTPAPTPRLMRDMTYPLVRQPLSAIGERSPERAAAAIHRINPIDSIDYMCLSLRHVAKPGRTRCDDAI